ncbi:MAG: hypothetical protein ABI221_01750 [Candidatus Saccharimonadales bacterium]
MAQPKKLQKSKKSVWFVKVRGSYLPVNWKGWLTYIPFVAFLLVVLLDALRTKNTIADIFYMIFPQWLGAVAVMTWIAWRKS